jgi:thiamine pyrophosphate-dependent acetolactate synthase large subunit-like protein
MTSFHGLTDDLLRRHGVTNGLGNPGQTSCHFRRIFRRISVISSVSMSVAVGMADGYAHGIRFALTGDRSWGTH